MHDPVDVLAGARRELASFPAVLATLLTDLDATAWRTRPAPAEWAPVEIVCHLRDEEVEDFGARLRVILEGGTAFVPLDPERWAVERRYLEDDGSRALASFRERRTASLGLLATIVPRDSVEASSTGGSAGSPGSISSPRGSSTIAFT